MKAQIAGGLISGAGSLLSTALNQAMYKHNLALQSSYQKGLFDYQSKVNDRLTRQLAIDSPMLQAQGKAKIGLNPYAPDEGNISTVSNSMPGAPGGAPGFGDLGSSVLSGMMQLAQIKNLEATTQGQEIANNQADERFQLFKEQVTSSIDQIKSNKDLTDVQKQLAEKDLQFYSDTYEDRLKQMNLTTTQFEQQSKLMEKDLGLKDEQIDQLRKSNSVLIRTAEANIFAAYAAGQCSKAQASLAYKNVALVAEHIEEAQRNNRFGDQTFDAMIASANARAGLDSQELNERRVTFPTRRELLEQSKDLQQFNLDKAGPTWWNDQIRGYLNVGTDVVKTGAMLYGAKGLNKVPASGYGNAPVNSTWSLSGNGQYYK